MSQVIFPKNYKSKLSVKETQRAIKLIKDTFQVKLAKVLNLDRVTAPIIVRSDSGINDDLNGIERKVTFDLKEMDGQIEVVQSLAKWKRRALFRFGYEAGEGIYTDMNALRRDDDMDNIHSVFVDQWDWEKVITKEDRNVDFLKDTVRKIVNALCYTLNIVKAEYPVIKTDISNDVKFVTSEDLLDMYPDLSPKERENAFVKEHRTVFIMQIGGLLSDGTQHDGRAPDYDDWSLNGDLMVYNDVLDSALEISSMGIRVDRESLIKQLKAENAEDRLKFQFHKLLVEGALPLTVGGGIGQSRLCMFLLQKAHVGEVQVSIWPEKEILKCKANGISLL